MEVSQTVNLYITFLEKEGPFLKVWGQTEKNNSIYVEQFLLGVGPQFDLGIGKVLLDSLQVGTLVCAKYKDNKYYRARITNVTFLQEGFVEVSFLDYGNKDVVPCGNIRSLQNCPSSFISIPPLATGFIFAEAHCPGGGEWNDTIFDNISKEIKYREVQCTLLIQATQYFLIKIYIGGNDLCSLLISRGLMQPISLQAQQAVLLSMSMQRQSQPLSHSSVPLSAGINTYKACTLEPNCQYPVYVSYVNDGPCHFSVQLKQSEDVLVMLMNDINAITLRPLEDVPIPGTICLSRCQEDGNICRAVVTNEVDNQFKVFYVDFGNYEVVPLDALYQIPFKYVIPKVMAIRFSLAGVEKSTVTLEMQCAFKQFVDNRLLHMKVLPSPTRTAIPKCELWDPETKTSALDVVTRAARNAYPEPISLNRGFSQLVKVSFVYGCNRFYVQLSSKENELLKLMLDLQSSCQANDPMDPASIKVGLPCCALFESDQQWYRSQVVEVLDDTVKVRYIDYGNEEVVPITMLKIIDGEQLTVLRPQAIECCLNGYQNMEDDVERDGILEELILEGLFTMKVVEMLNKKALVELFDNSNYNMSSLLFEKLAAAKSQVSPILVQAGNKIEHRKSFSQPKSPRDQNFRQERKPGREYNKSFDRTNDRNEKPEKPWRQDNKDYRNYDKHSNENANERGSWRDNSKGFSPTNDRYKPRDGNRDRPDRSRNTNERPAKPNYAENDSRDAPVANNVGQAAGDDWEAPTNDVAGNSKANNFDRGKGRFDSDKENWNAGGQRGGFKKRNDFRKDGSELSSSGSEKSFQKGPRTSSRNDRFERPKFQKKFDKPRNAPFNNSSVITDSWDMSAVTSPIDAAPATAGFPPCDVVGTEAKIIISWFHNPAHFYCQLFDVQEPFKKMMEEIQLFYKSRKPESSVAGAPIVGLFPEDNVLYRARVLEVLGSQYRVYYVDFGNVSTISKVWPIERKFMELPAQAIICSLSGIGPPGEQWADVDSFANYFDKDVYVCRFVNKDEEKTYVNLSYGNDDIAQLLIRDGLASSTQTIIPDIEIPILLGQQFRAVVKSINNLSDIIIALECGVALTCKMHNVETATETHEDTLRGLLEQTVIVYVDNVIDDRLEVTLYDTEGCKITIVDPDEGAYDTVDILCPPLVLSSVLTGIVSHVDDCLVYIQPAMYGNLIAYLLDSMFNAFDAQKQDLPIIPEEGLLYAVHSEDTNWYRGKVVSFDDEKATIFYVDYGNSENVSFYELRELDDEFLVPCTLCVQVTVNAPTDNLIDKYVTANVSYGDNGWEGFVEVQVPDESSATESMDMERGEAAGTTVTEPLTELPEKEIVQETCVEQETPSTEVPSADVVASSSTESAVMGTQVVVSHIDTPNEFYLQLLESVEAVDNLQASLQEQIPEMAVLETPAAGVLCAAPYSADQTWYRAEVLDADDDITTVRFVDYGNTDVIDNNTTKIKTLPPSLLSLAVYATRCSLKVKSPDEEWSATALKTFEDLANADCVTVEFVDQDEKTNYVELFSNGENVKDVLIGEKLGVPMELPLDSKSTGFVSHLNSPSEFWIQLENCVDELEWIAEQLSGSETFPELEDFTPGTLCAALFPDDEMWYRARILSNTVAGIELLFIDYGNSCTSNSLRQLPEDLVVTAPLAQKCSLQKPDGVPYWTPQAAAKFAEISEDGKTIFTVRKITTGETSVVQLLVDGVDVTTMLTADTEEGRVVDVESPEKFSIEKDGEKLPESYQLEAMPGTTWTEESTKKLEELTDQGTTIFQIEFLADNTVRLYLDGKDIRPNLEAVKIVPLNVSSAGDDDESYRADETVIEETAAHDIEKDIESSKSGEIIATEAVTGETPSKDIEEEVVPCETDETAVEETSQDTKEDMESRKADETVATQTASQAAVVAETLQDTEEDTESRKADETVARETSSQDDKADVTEVVQDTDKDTESHKADEIVAAETASQADKADVAEIVQDTEKDTESHQPDETVATETSSQDDKADVAEIVQDTEKDTESHQPDETVATETSSQDDKADVAEIVQDTEKDTESHKPDETVATETASQGDKADVAEIVQDTEKDTESHKADEIVATETASQADEIVVTETASQTDKIVATETASQVDALVSETSQDTEKEIESHKADELIVTEPAPQDIKNDKDNATKIVIADEKTSKDVDFKDEITEGDKDTVVQKSEITDVVADVQPAPKSPNKGDDEENVNVKTLLHEEVEKALDKLDADKDTIKYEIDNLKDSPESVEKPEATKIETNAPKTVEELKEVADEIVEKPEIMKSEGDDSRDETIEIQKTPRNEIIIPKNDIETIDKPKDDIKTVQKPETTGNEVDNSETVDSSSGTSAEMISLLHQELDKALDRKTETSRPPSSCSGKIKHDDRILPATISRPQTPEVASVSPSKSRPASAGSGKINFDERIVPAVLSRPQSPLPASDDKESQNGKDEK